MLYRCCPTAFAMSWANFIHCCLWKMSCFSVLLSACAVSIVLWASLCTYCFPPIMWPTHLHSSCLIFNLTSSALLCSLILSFILIFSILHSTDLCAVVPFCEVVYILYNLSQVVVKLFISSLKRGSSKGSFTWFVHERIHVICSYMISVQ